MIGGGFCMDSVEFDETQATQDARASRYHGVSR